MRIAQVLGLCMVALAAGAVVFKPGMPEARTDAGVDPGSSTQDPDPGNNATGGTSGGLGIEHNPAGERLNRIAGITVQRETDDTPDPDPDPMPPTPAADGWMYLGGVFEPTTNFAFVSVNGVQRMIREGQELTDLDTRVLSITPKMIEIERSGVRERIDRAEAVGALVSVSDTSTDGAAIITPVSPSRDPRVIQREELENNPDMDKRRAEFLRRQRERQGLDQ